MKKEVDRRSFLRLAGTGIGIGALYSVVPLAAKTEAQDVLHLFGEKNGERVSPFTFVQLSDTHVGFNGPPNPLGTEAFKKAIERVNALPQRPDLVLFTGDLIHDTEDKDEQVRRIRTFQQLSAELKGPKLFFVPGEHDAGLDGGVIFRENFGETHYSFDHKGVHFIALDNVSRARPEVGTEQINWLKRDLVRYAKTSPIIVFTHRPLFDLKPEWEWFTSDGDDVMNVLAAYSNVTVLYGHIHREHEHQGDHARHLAARSLAFAFPDPDKVADKKPLPFDKEAPFKNLGLRVISEKSRSEPLNVNDIELSSREFAGINGAQQLLKSVVL
jgi:3',5'-cyclic AMP phosphodiesterase CpdA